MPTTPPLPDEPGNGEGLLKPIPRPAAAPSAAATTPTVPQQPRTAPQQPAAPGRPAAVAATPTAAKPRRPAPATSGRPGIPHLSPQAPPRINATAGAAGSATTATAAAGAPRTRTPLDEPFTESQLNLMWDAYIGANPTAHILTNTMRASRPKLVERTRFVVAVENDKQVETMNSAATSLMEYLRAKLRNDNITFEVVVNSGESSPRTWNTREVFHHMVETHPAVKQFIESFKMNLN